MSSDIERIIEEKVKNITSNQNIYDMGIVTMVQNYIIDIKGLEGVSYFEKVTIANKAVGYVAKIERSKVIVALVQIDQAVCVGDYVTATGEEFKASYARQSFGHIVDIFGIDKMVGKRFEEVVQINIENPTIPIMERGAVHRPLLTGIAGIDLMYPIGKGQRQLILGDKKTGKTQIGLDIIVNQKEKDVICIYVSLGKTKKDTKQIYHELLKHDAMENTIIFTACNDDAPPVIYLTPYVALSVAEEYMKQGKDVVVIIDDLKRHADNYREISLLTGKQPGRDAYPSDIFYTHSRMLEKGCQYYQGGSITILPIVETKSGDITDYISTNIISITDGQIVLSKKDFEKGQKPAINYGLSVSRLGSAVQDKKMKEVGATVRLELLSYLETRDIYELANTDQMAASLREKLINGKKLNESLRQYKFSPKSTNEILRLLYDVVGS